MGFGVSYNGLNNPTTALEYIENTVIWLHGQGA